MEKNGLVFTRVPYTHKGKTITQVPGWCPDDEVFGDYDIENECGVTEHTATTLKLILDTAQDGITEIPDKIHYPKALGVTIASIIGQALPSKLRKLFDNSAIIAGGCFASAVVGDRINDVDIFFKDARFLRKFGRLINEHIPQEHRFDLVYDGFGYSVMFMEEHSGIEAGVGRKRKIDQVSLNCEISDKIKVIAIGPNAITARFDGLPYTAQIVTRLLTQDIIDLKKQFDFAHTQFFYDVLRDEYVASSLAERSAIDKTLIYTGSKYPFSSMVRMVKYIRRGWSISPSQMFLIANDLSKLDMHDSGVLLDQLLSIDVAYFLNVLSEVGIDANELVAAFKSEYEGGDFRV